jgi:hypothetical protein
MRPMKAGHGQGILNLSISDKNKQLLLNAPGFVELLVDSLFNDPQHPRREQQVRDRLLLRHFRLKTDGYQDRLGTSTGKTRDKEMRFLLADL